MRFRTFIVWMVGLAVVGWAGLTTMSASSSYMTAREMVDQVLQESTSKVRAAAAAGSQQPLDDLADDVRDAVLIRARRHGIPIDSRDLVVFSRDGGITVRLKWSYPAFTYRDDVIVNIPMSIERSTRTR